MKTRETLFFARLIQLIFALLPAVAAVAQTQSVTLDKAGTLSDHVARCDESVTALTIAGELNGDDIALLRTLTQLKKLDLSDAAIVSGGNPYLNNLRTADGEVGDSMFLKMPLVTLMLPQGTTRIGHYALRDCERLTAITLPEQVSAIGRYAFLNCTSLKTVTFDAAECQADCRLAGRWYPPFTGCPIATLNIGKQVTAIPDALFWDERGSFSFDNLVLSSAVTSVGHFAFYRCDALKRVTLPATLARLGAAAFAECSQLVTINYYAEECQADFKYDGAQLYPFNRSPFSLLRINSGVRELPANLFVGGGSSSTLTVTISDGVESIGDNCFSGLLMRKITLPRSLRSMGRSAFAGCTKLKSLCYEADDCAPGWLAVEEGDTLYYSPFKLCPLNEVIFGDSVRTLPAGLLWNSSNSFEFTELTLPAAVQSVGPRALRECLSLERLNCLSPLPPAADFNSFYTIELDDCTLTVPAGSGEAYRAAFPWSRFGTINEE